MPENTEHATIQSVSRALSILEVIFESNQPMSVQEISQALGLSRTTAHGLVRTLVACKYIEKEPLTRKYMPTSKMYGMSCAYPHKLKVMQVINPYLRSLLTRYRQTIHLGIMSTRDTVLLLKAYFPERVPNLTRIFNLPMHATGIGKTMLAFLPPEQREAILENIELTPYTKNTITDLDRLREEIETIRQRGYGYDMAEYLDNTFCVGFPILGDRDEAVAAFSVSGQQKDIEPLFPELIPESLQVSKTCSGEMGWTPIF